MAIKKHCPNCGGKIEEDSLFCSECGNKLENIGFFDKLNKKTNFPLLIFSFIVLGVFLFIGSIILRKVWHPFLGWDCRYKRVLKSTLR